VVSAVNDTDTSPDARESQYLDRSTVKSKSIEAAVDDEQKEQTQSNEIQIELNKDLTRNIVNFSPY
jgi:hypothetical protein